MNLTPEQQDTNEARDLAMFGCTKADLHRDWARSSKLYLDRELYIMAILSDAQQVMEFGQHETARQFINKAKWHLTEIITERREPPEPVVAHMVLTPVWKPSAVELVNDCNDYTDVVLYIGNGNGTSGEDWKFGITLCKETGVVYAATPTYAPDGDADFVQREDVPEAVLTVYRELRPVMVARAIKGYELPTLDKGDFR